MRGGVGLRESWPHSSQKRPTRGAPHAAHVSSGRDSVAAPAEAGAADAEPEAGVGVGSAMAAPQTSQ